MKKTKIITFTVASVVLCVGVVCIVFGALRGEADVVFEKAIRICMECIGIG